MMNSITRMFRGRVAWSRVRTLFTAVMVGFALMSVELVASRVVAPIAGGSLYTWTSLIGTIITGLSLGAFFGGMCADGAHMRRLVPIILALMVVCVTVVIPFARFLESIARGIDSVIFLNVVLATTLFLPFSVLTGMLEPMLFRMYTESYETVGRSMGRISAATSLGSIAGVFITGFVLISYLGTATTLWYIACMLGALAIVYMPLQSRLVCVITGVLTVGALGYRFVGGYDTRTTGYLLYGETRQYTARVFDMVHPVYGASRVLALDGDVHSIRPTYMPESFYPRFAPLFGYVASSTANILMFGGGAYTMPIEFAKRYPHARIEVVENDPGVYDIARTFFDLDAYPITTHVVDARAYFGASTTTYDMIIGDAYNSFVSVPWFLLTQEWHKEVRRHTAPGGVYAINFIGTLAPGERGALARSIISTFVTVFPESFIVLTGGVGTGSAIQNIFVVGVNSDSPVDLDRVRKRLAASATDAFLANTLRSIDEIELTNGMLLTDDSAPTDRLIAPIVREYYPLNRDFFAEIMR